MCMFLQTLSVLQIQVKEIRGNYMSPRISNSSYWICITHSDVTSISMYQTKLSLNLT